MEHTRTLCFILFLQVLVLVSTEDIFITFTIPEEEESNEPFGNIATESAPLLKTNRTDLRYFFLQSVYQSMFSINDESGEIFTTIVIDRETVCEFDAICKVEFEVAVKSQDGTFFQIVSVQVFIEDKNDNSPMFPSETSMLNISEGSSVGSKFVIPLAEDKDKGGNNSIQSYELAPNADSNGTFSISVTKNQVGTFRVYLVVNKVLDRETRDSYNVKVIAKDGGSPVRTGSLIMTVKVQDINDNQPEFSKQLYNITVKESTPIDDTILILSADDKDIGENARISYRIKESQKGKDVLDQIFRLNEFTGELKVKSELTSKAGESLRFIVEALDHGLEPYITETEVLVNIEDSGNNAPIVSVGFLSPGNKKYVNVSENSNIGAFVAHVNVDDTDKGSNGNVSCTVSNNHFGIDDLDGKGFIVVVKSLLDREVKNVYNLTVTCSDQGKPVMSGSAGFLVHVTDKNDNKPDFDSPVYSAKIYENNKGNEMILQVSASDKDLGKNAQVVYDVHDEALGRFVIDRNTGVISVNDEFDRETSPLIVFQVLAIDGGETPLTGTATVSVTIEDRNDNAPEFTKSLHGFTILENQPTGTTVDTLSATDIDTGFNAEVDFIIAPEYVDQVPFILFSNGVLKANKQLDREERSRYDFVAIVRDHGDNQLSASTHVTVIVEDDNDNAPIFTFPEPSNNTVTLLYPGYEDEYVTTAQAYDLDDGQNKAIQYSIKSGNNLEILDINKDSGVIYFKNKVDIGGDKTLEIDIAATDMGNVAKESVQTLYLELKYTNATFAGSKSDEENSKHIIIAVVVVIVTILISGIILGIILFLRTHDRRKNLFKAEDTPNPDTDFGFHGMTQSHMIISPDTLSSSSLEGRDPMKKKEVSFILDTSDSIDCAREMQNSSLNSSYSKSKPYKSSNPYSHNSDSGLDVHDLQKEANAQLQSIKLQQMILQNRAKHWVQTQHQNQYVLPAQDDHHSEGSSETIGSDSGRGCSEEDDLFSTPSADDPKLFDVSSPESQRCYPPQTDPYTNREIFRTSSYVKKPWTRKPHLATKDIKNSKTCLSLNRNLYANPPIVPVDMQNDLSNIGRSRMSWGSAYHNHGPMDYTGDSALHSFFNKTPMYVLRDEDDNCSTTTSGSYTIQSEEIL